MEQRRFIFIFVFLWSLATHAEFRELPTDKVEAEPITTFSDETGAWPSQKYDSEIFETQAISTFETLNHIPGIETRGSLSKGSPAVMLRGSTKAARTLLMYDGIPLNLSDGVGAQELLIPREALGDLQVIKGPASVYYGASAMAGAVNFNPEFYTRSRLRATTGSFGQKGLFGAASVMSSDRNQLQITGFNETIDGDYPYYSPTSGQSGVRTRTNTHTQRGTLSGNHNVSGYKIGYRILQAQEFGSSPGSLSFSDPTSSQKTGSIYALKLSKAYGTHWNVKLHGSQVRVLSHFLTESTQALYESNSAQTASGFLLGYNEGSDFNIQLLGDYKENSLQTPTTQNKEQREQKFEPGTLLQFPFAEDIVLQSGLRYVPDAGVVTKTIGAIRSRLNQKFWMTYAEGYRPPSLSDKYDQTSTFHGNPDLKPEQSSQIEVGASQDGDRTSNNFLTHLNYETSVFSATYLDLITTTSDFSTVRNTDLVRAWGGELQLSYPMELLALGLGYSYLDASASSTPLPYTTEQKVIGTLAHYFGPLVFEIENVSWINYRRSAAPKDKTSWNTTDLKVRTLALSDWVFSAGYLNMFDETVEYITGYPEPRKRFYLSLERLF